MRYGVDMDTRETVRLVFSPSDWGNEDVTSTENEQLCELMEQRLRHTCPEFGWDIAAVEAGASESSAFNAKQLLLTDDDAEPYRGINEAVDGAWGWALSNMKTS
jgi:hypothetical protein